MSMQWQAGPNQWAAQMAQQNADNAYREALLAGQGQDQALRQAQFAWQKTVDEAGLTGKYQGEWTMPTQQYFANTFGSWGAPTQGQQTQSMQNQMWNQGLQNALAYGQYFAPGTGPQAGQQTLGAQGQAAQIAAGLANQFGQYYAPGTGPEAGTQTLASQQQQFAQQLARDQEARALAGQQQGTAQNYLNLLSQLRGPADWFKYQEVLGSTPGGMRDLVAAAMGQYVPGGGATTGVNPQAANLQTMMGQVAGGIPSSQGYGGVGAAPGGPTNVAAGQAGPYQLAGGQAATGQAAQFQNDRYQAAQQAYGGNQLQEQMMNMFRGKTAQPQATVGQQQGLPQVEATQQAYQQAQQQRNALGGGTNVWGAQQPGQPQANQMNLPAPNQIAAQSWKNMAPSQQQMLMGAYESQGWNKDDVRSLYEQSLPKYASNAATAGTFRMG